jgi:hypothetical protein
MNKLFAVLKTEPVRALLHPLILGAFAYLVARGVITQDASQYLVAAVLAVLGIPAVEVARSKVYSQATVDKG